MLSVLFNASSLRLPMTGVGQYTLQLARGLAALQAFELDFFDGARSSRELRCDPSARRGTTRAWVRRFVPRAYDIKRLLDQRRFDRASRGHELYHEPATLPLDFDGKTVVTVHDLSWIRHPGTHPPQRVRALARHFEPALRKASCVLTGSAFIKQEIIDEFGLPPASIEVIPHGRDPAFQPMGAEQTSAVLGARGLAHGGYFLSVGTLEPRKNLALAIRAHAALPAAVRARFPLVIAGMKGWGDSPLGTQFATAVASADIRIVGYLERGDLARLTAGALALVYPSLYEGFGLPPLEAMACGVPPITSNAASLPEVVGDAGLMVDPSDVDGLAAAMQRIAVDPAKRSELSARSQARAESFSWERCALATAAAYRRVAAGGGPS